MDAELREIAAAMRNHRLHDAFSLTHFRYHHPGAQRASTQVIFCRNDDGREASVPYVMAKTLLQPSTTWHSETFWDELVQHSGTVDQRMIVRPSDIRPAARRPYRRAA